MREMDPGVPLRRHADGMGVSFAYVRTHVHAHMRHFGVMDCVSECVRKQGKQ